MNSSDHRMVMTAKRINNRVVKTILKNVKYEL